MGYGLKTNGFYYHTYTWNGVKYIYCIRFKHNGLDDDEPYPYKYGVKEYQEPFIPQPDAIFAELDEDVQYYVSTFRPFHEGVLFRGDYTITEIGPNYFKEFHDVDLDFYEPEEKLYAFYQIR